MTTIGSVQDLLFDLVSIPGTSGNEGPAVEWLVQRMSELGYASRIDPAGNAVGMIGCGPLEIMLLGHIDTVPGNIQVRIENGILHGRGAVDARGPLATFVLAGCKARLLEHIRLTVIGAVGEESLGSPGASWLRDNHPAPAAVVIGEPGGWEGIVLGYKGSMGCSARVTRSMSHSAGPESTSAQRIVDFWQSVTDWITEYNGATEPGFATLDGTLQQLASGDDGFDEWATLSANFRLPLGVSAAEVGEQLSLLASRDDVDLNWRLNAEAFRLDRRSPFIAPFRAAIRAQGGQPTSKVKTGTADMNIVGPAWGCPILAYGPGDSAYDHRPDEQISLAEVARAVDVLTDAIERYARQISGVYSNREMGIHA